MKILRGLLAVAAFWLWSLAIIFQAKAALIALVVIVIMVASVAIFVEAADL